MTQRLASVVLALVLTASAFAQKGGETTGSIQGTVFTNDPDGGRSVVPTARISLDGPVHLEAESNGVGKFVFKARTQRYSAKSAAAQLKIGTVATMFPS